MLPWAWLAGIPFLCGRRAGGNAARNWAQGYPRPGLPCPAGEQGEKGAGTSLGHCLAISLLVLHHLLGFLSALFLNFLQPTSFLAAALSVLFPIPAECTRGCVGAELLAGVTQLSWAGVLCWTCQGKGYFHGENLQTPHSITWSLIGSRSWRKGRIHSSLGSWGEELCSGGCSASPAFPEDGR